MKVKELSFIQSRCSDPVRLKQWNFLTHQMEDVEVPCGKCNHCKMTHQNEWCTRMFLESKYRKYTYFITLTYDKNCDAKILQETNAMPCCFNTYHKYETTPLTLNKTHTQEFWKRLRKIVGYNNFSYVIVGEYGHKYGRPHYHAMVFSDIVITKEHFQMAWSLYGRNVGNIDYVDISSKPYDEFVNATRYVSKYLQKDFDFNTIPTLKQHIKNNNRHDKYEITKKTLTAAYIKDYRPFMLQSRTHAIGSGYLKDNIDRFKKGDYRLFGVSEKDLVFPKYFFKKAKEALCPIQTFNCLGKASVTPNRLENLFAFFDHAQDIDKVVEMDMASGQSPMALFRANRKRIGEMSRFNPMASQPYAIDETAFYDKQTKCYNILIGKRYIGYKYDKYKKRYKVEYENGADEVIEYLKSKFEDYKVFCQREYDNTKWKQEQFKEAVIAEFVTKEDGELTADEAYQLGYMRWQEYAKDILKNVDEQNKTKQIKYKNTKQLF